MMDLTPPHQCREKAQEEAERGVWPAATAWALLAIAGELAEARRVERKRSR
jgi:hypothetical protein